MGQVTDIPHANVLQRHEIVAFLDYYDGLKADMEPGAHDDDYCCWGPDDYDWTRDQLDGYDEEVVDQLRQMVNDSRDDSWVSEDYWEEYASQYADDVFGLEGTGITPYFDYSAFAADYKQDYTEYEYDGKSYYSLD